VKVKLPGRLLQSLVKACCTVTDPADERQILRNLLLVATPAGLEVSATDTIVALWLNIPASEAVVVEKPGRVVVNAQNLMRTVETVCGRDVTLVATERGFQIVAGGSKFKLCIEDANDFPKITRFSTRKPFTTVNSDLFIKMLDRTAFCAHDEPSFQLMHGLLIRTVPTEIRMVATNGQRLSVTTLPMTPAAPAPISENSSPDASQPDASSPDASETEVVVPAEVAGVLKKIIGPNTKTVDLQWMTAFFNARTDLGEVTIRALSGSYPMYGRGVPNDLKKLKMDRQDLIDVLKQTTAIKSATSNFVALTFKKDRIVFSAIAEGAGDTEVEYEHPWDDEEYEITISPDFMLDTLTAFRGEYVLFEVGDVMSPTILRELNEADNPASFCVYAVVRQ
jgi:DNA polymerase III subunit beta